MAQSLAEQEEAVRPYAELGWTTREIARRVHLSQSTVVRVIQRINTGPQPILARENTRPQPVLAQQNTRRQRRRPSPLLWVPLAVLILVLGILAAAAVTAPRTPRVLACVQYSGRYVTGIIVTRTTCATGWKPLILAPGR